MLVIKALAVFVSIVLDFLGAFSTAAFFWLLKTTTQHIYAAHLYRFFFLIISFLSTLNSVVATKVLLFLSQIQNLTGSFAERNQSFLIFFKASTGIFYFFAILQVLTLISMLAVKISLKNNGRELKYAKFLFTGIVLVVGFIVGGAFLWSAHLYTQDGVIMFSTGSFVSSCILLFLLSVWLVIILTKNVNLAETAPITIGMVVFVTNLVAIELGTIPELQLLLDPAYTALPMSASFFTCSVIYSDFIFYTNIREAMKVKCRKLTRPFKRSRSTTNVTYIGNNELVSASTNMITRF